jgi:5-methyltetrahydrofolate corrinoid/iron sulfur protein methyltransferase
MLLIADNLQIVNPHIAAAVEHGAAGPVQALVRRCLAAGAHAIDINAGPLPRDAAGRMRFLVETVQSLTDVPLVLDSANPEALAAGLAASRNRTILNGVSLEPAKLRRILPLAVAHQVEVIGYLLRPDGQVPGDADERMALAVALHAACRAAGLPEERLIIDPIVAPVIWQDGLAHNRAVLAVLRRLPELLGFAARSVVGLSNLTSGGGPARGRRLLEQAFVPMLAEAGLEMLLLNVLHADTMALLRACRLLREPTVFAWELLEEAGG